MIATYENDIALLLRRFASARRQLLSVGATVNDDDADAAAVAGSPSVSSALSASSSNRIPLDGTDAGGSEILPVPMSSLAIVRTSMFANRRRHRFGDNDGDNANADGNVDDGDMVCFDETEPSHTDSMPTASASSSASVSASSSASFLPPSTSLVSQSSLTPLEAAGSDIRALEASLHALAAERAVILANQVRAGEEGNRPFFQMMQMQMRTLTVSTQMHRQSAVLHEIIESSFSDI